MHAPRHAAARLLAVLALALTGCTGATGTPPEIVESLADGRSGAVSFATRAPYDFVDLAGGGAPEDRIAGRLVLPEGDGAVRAAAILSHGAGGTGGRQDRMADWLAGRGIAAFVLDHFGPRGIGSTVRDQLRATEQTMVADLFAARALLATHPRIGDAPAGVMGWSKGATAATLSILSRVAGAAGAEPFDFAVAFYPFCGFALGEEPVATPLLMLLAGADDWTPAAPCADLARDWAAAGDPVAAVVFEDAPHGFDSGMWWTIPVGRAITVRDRSDRCTLDLGPDLATRTVDGAHRLGDVAGRVAFLDDCGERGVTFGGDGAATEAAYDRVAAFLAERLP